MSKKNVATDVKSGRPRTNITNITDTKMDFPNGVKNVQIKLPMQHVKND